MGRVYRFCLGLLDQHFGVKSNGVFRHSVQSPSACLSLTPATCSWRIKPQPKAPVSGLQRAFQLWGKLRWQHHSLRTHSQGSAPCKYAGRLQDRGSTWTPFALQSHKACSRVGSCSLQSECPGSAANGRITQTTRIYFYFLHKEFSDSLTSHCSLPRPSLSSCSCDPYSLTGECLTHMNSLLEINDYSSE